MIPWTDIIGGILEIVATILKNRVVLTQDQLDAAVASLKVAPPPKGA